MSNINDEIKQMESKLAELKKQQAQQLATRLKTLHTELGFSSKAELIAALGGKGGGASVATGGKRTRARITDEIRAKIVADLKAGTMTGAEVAKKYGISLPSVANIKRDAGLTATRKKRK